MSRGCHAKQRYLLNIVACTIQHATWKIALARALDGGATFRLARSYSPNAAANGQHASHQSNSEEEQDIQERVDGMRTSSWLTTICVIHVRNNQLLRLEHIYSLLNHEHN